MCYTIKHWNILYLGDCVELYLIITLRSKLCYGRNYFYVRIIIPVFCSSSKMLIVSFSLKPTPAQLGVHTDITISPAKVYWVLIEAFYVKINWWRCIYISVSLDIHLILFHTSVHVSVAINKTIVFFYIFFVVGNCYIH